MQNPIITHNNDMIKQRYKVLRKTSISVNTMPSITGDLELNIKLTTV